jgi:hypothetical protein
MNSYFYIFETPLFTVNGQIVLKWRLGPFGILPAGAKEKALSESFLFSGFIGVSYRYSFFRRNLCNSQRNRIIIDTFRNFYHC